MTERNKILLVTVLYNERIETTKTYDTFLRQKEMDVLVIENSPRPLNGPENLHDSWQYVSFPNNPGLSAAYNYAARYAEDHGYEWLLLTDQDTTFPDGIFEKYQEAIIANLSIVLFCPRIDVGTEKYMSPVPMIHYQSQICTSAPIGEIDLHHFSVINSGMLIQVKAFMDVGGYNDKVKLDFADFQFIERLRKKYNKAFVLDAVCHQEFSNEVHSKEQKINRYRLFCQSLKHFECEKSKDRKYIHYTVFRRACSLALSEKTLIPFYFIFKYYWR